MKLPLRDEIHEIREQAMAAQDAMMLQAQVSAAIQGTLACIEVLKKNPKARPDRVVADAFETVAEKFPTMAPQPISSTTGDLPAFKQDLAVLRQIQSFISPVAVEAEELAHQLHHLQHEQADQLSAPDYSEALSELQQFEKRRVEAREKAAPLADRRMKLQSAHNVLDNLLGQLHVALDANDPISEHRLVAICTSVFATLARIISSLGLDIALRAPPDVTPPLSMGARISIENYVTRLEELDERIVDALSDIILSHDKLESVRKQAVEELLKRMG